MKPDLSDFEVEGGPGGDNPCAVGNILIDLDEQRQVSLQAALDELVPHPTSHHKYRFSAERVSLTLRKWGYMVGEDTVKRHRKGACRCPR